MEKKIGFFFCFVFSIVIQYNDGSNDLKSIHLISFGIQYDLIYDSW